MFLVHQELLIEDNLELFLEIINNIITYRKENMKIIKKIKFFEILCLFLEKYPNNIFTSKILKILFLIGKNIFASINKFESLCANYFKYILLNEKILSKFDENLQITFWNNIYKFCESDKSQIEILININRLCLILRFYDKNKYFEMCCEEHLNVFKEEFIGSKKVMNPPMKTKLSYLKDIMDLIILEQDPKNAVSLFKLLTLDLSPCLTKFVLNIFINAFEKDSEKGKDWTNKLVNELFKANIEVIISNIFVHSLPDIRFDIIRFLYYVYHKLIRQNAIQNFKKIENMINTCLLPDKLFYENVIKEENVNEEVLVIKDEIFSEYINGLFCILLDWICDREISLKKELEADFDIIIRNINGIEMLAALNSELKNSEFNKKFLNIINYMIIIEGNSFLFLSNINIMNYLLDLSFNYFLSKNDKNNNTDELNEITTFYELTKLLILNVYKNSLIYIEKQAYTETYPLEKIEIIFIWGTRILKKEEDTKLKETLFEFLSDILFSLLHQYCELNDIEINNFFSKTGLNISENYYIKNYLIMLTKLFHFLFLYKFDSNIVGYDLSIIASYTPKIDLPHRYFSSMRIGSINSNKFEEYWADFKFFNEFYEKVRHLWKMEKLFNEHNLKKIKKENKYDYILKNIILVKEKKNIYQTELENLFFKEIKDEEESIISPMKIIIINLMSILSKTNDLKYESDMLYWLKEFKSFLKFIIISSKI